MHIHCHLFIIWLHQHPHWGGVAAFLVAFAESVAIIGSIVPGSVTMTAVGVLIGSGVLPIWTTLIWAIAGAFIGDGISFLLGLYFKEQVRNFWPFSRYPRIISVGEAFFMRHGGKSILIGRFVGPVRAIVPIISGMLNMRPRRYFTISLFSAICWAPLYMLPGMLLGAVSLAMPADIATQLIIFILLLLVIVWLAFWLIKIIYQKTHNYFAALLDQKWQQWLKQPSKYWLCNLLRRADYPQSHGQLLLASVMLVCLGLFFLISVDAFLHGPLSHWENGVYHLFRGLRTEALDKMVVVIMSFGYYKILSMTMGALVCWLAFRRRWLAVIHWMLAWVLVLVSVFAFKILYLLGRPPGLLNAPVYPSFPSRYITGAIVFYILFAFMFARDMHREVRKYIYWLAAIICIAIALARLYLGLNWFTDVLSGIFLAGAIVSFVIISYRRYKAVKLSALGILLVTVISLVIGDSFYLYANLDRHLHDYQRYWSTQTISENDWWNRSTADVPLYRADRFGRPVQIFNLQWAGSLQEIKKTLHLHGWREFHDRSYADVILQLLQQTDFTKQRPLMAQLYDDRPPVLVMINHYAADRPPVIIHLWKTNIVLLPRRIPLWVGTVTYLTVSKHFIFFHRVEMFPAVAQAEHLKLLSEHVWCAKDIKFVDFPKGMRHRSENLRILLVKKCYSL